MTANKTINERMQKNTLWLRQARIPSESSESDFNRSKLLLHGVVN